MVVGDMPLGRHGFNMLYYGNELPDNKCGFLLWEPNEGFECSGDAFEIVENGYTPKQVLI